MRSKPPVERRKPRAGFTLLEILAAIALLVVILAMTASIINSTSRVWRQASAKVESFQTGRAAFDVMTSRLSKASLNTYWDYYDDSGTPSRSTANSATFTPARYGRYSDLHFCCGQASKLITTLPPELTATSTQAVFFVAPTGLSSQASYNGVSGLLAACGYFVAFGSDDASKPSFLSTSSRYRWRLMEVSEPVESLQVFNSASGTSWFTAPISQGKVRAVAENVIALIVWPRKSSQDDPAGDALSDDFSYDSRTTAPWSGTPLRQPVQAHQLPPNLQVTMVVIDEVDAKRMEKGSAIPSPITSALNGLFTKKVSDYGDNLKTLESRLATARINYRVFSTTVALKESKWSP